MNSYAFNEALNIIGLDKQTLFSSKHMHLEVCYGVVQVRNTMSDRVAG